MGEVVPEAMTNTVSHSALAAMQLLTQARRVAAEHYADMIEAGGRHLNWGEVNDLIAASMGRPRLHEIQRDAHRIVLARNTTVAAQLERMRVYSRQVVSIKCAVADCANTIKPGDWAFWPGGPDRHSGFICEVCAVARAIEARS